MIADIWTVIWKEWKELARIHRGQRKMGIIITIPVLVMLYFSVIPSLQPDQLKSPAILFFVGVFAITPVMSIIADSFAGERERHTLETLLASRLPDLAILLGKLLATILYGWALCMIIPLGLAAAINAKFRSEGIQFFPLPIALSIPLIGFLTATLGTGVGVLISLRAETVKQTQATLTVVMMAIFMIPNLTLVALPHEMRDRFIQWVKALNLPRTLMLACTVLFVLDCVILAITVLRFRRSRLITRT